MAKGDLISLARFARLTISLFKDAKEIVDYAITGSQDKDYR
ncbi:MAG: hypothetical protein QXO37_07325 [Candidatus Nitrosocaldaceae archaeon]